MKKSIYMIAAVAGAVLVVVGVLWFVRGGATGQAEEESGNLRTNEEIPEFSGGGEPAEDAGEKTPPAETPAVDPKARPTKVGEMVNGYVMLPSGRIHKRTGAVTNHVANYGKSKYSIFKYRSDNEIARILMSNPGSAVVGTRRYDMWFEKQFQKSLETPITISEDDEEWQADLKRLVIQARQELKEAHDRGEDVAEIMSESRRQLQDLSGYRRSIGRVYAEKRRECATEEEVAQLQQAVNAMLEQKGCAPMNFTPLTKMHLMKEETDE